MSPQVLPHKRLHLTLLASGNLFSDFWHLKNASLYFRLVSNTQGNLCSSLHQAPPPLQKSFGQDATNCHRKCSLTSHTARQRQSISRFFGILKNASLRFSSVALSDGGRAACFGRGGRRAPARRQMAGRVGGGHGQGQGASAGSLPSASCVGSFTATVKIQSRYSQDTVKIQSRYSQDAALI